MKIFTNGCFDVIHRGHLDLFKFCRSIGSRLIVGLNCDAVVTKLKGEGKPVFNQDDRKYLLESLKWIDEVHIFEEDTPLELLKKVKPDLIVKGSEYRPEDVPGYGIYPVAIFNSTIANNNLKYSTSEIVRRMR